MMKKLGFKKLTKVGVSSALVLCLLCKLPWILAFLGLTVLGSNFEQLPHYSPLIVLSLIAIVSGIGLWFYRKHFRKTVMQHDT